MQGSLVKRLEVQVGKEITCRLAPGVELETYFLLIREHEIWNNEYTDFGVYKSLLNSCTQRFLLLNIWSRKDKSHAVVGLSL